MAAQRDPAPDHGFSMFNGAFGPIVRAPAQAGQPVTMLRQPKPVAASVNAEVPDIQDAVPINTVYQPA